jgi:type IV secretory pathway component VirB8
LPLRGKEVAKGQFRRALDKYGISQYCSLRESLKTSEINDMKSGIVLITYIVKMYGNLAMTFNTGTGSNVIFCPIFQ